MSPVGDLVTRLAMGQEAFRVGAVFTVLALTLLVFVRRERRRIFRFGVWYASSLLLRALAVGAGGLAMPATARTLDFLALALQGFAFVGLAFVVLFDVLLPKVRMAPPRILRDLSFGLVCLALLFYFFSIYQVDVTGVVATSAVVTAIIGFSLQDTLGNVMGGIALQLDGAIREGDWVLFEKVAGQVREIRWRHTSIETRNGDTLIIPNSLIMKGQVLVRGRRAEDPEIRERRWVYFHVDYRFLPTQVVDVVLEALTREPIPHVATTPAPGVILWEYKESYATYAVRYWLTSIAEDDATDAMVRTRVYFSLRRWDIPLSIPAQSVFVTPEGPEREDHVKARGRAARMKALEAVSLFDALTADERERLAERLSYAPFAPGEAMVVQGSAVHHLYILTRGTAAVRLAVEGTAPRMVATLEAPGFFGEMGMLTGEPRRATVIATSQVECWRLEKEKFQEILAARPEMADGISHVLATRAVNLEAAREGLSEESRHRRVSDAHNSILGRIREFFALT